MFVANGRASTIWTTEEFSSGTVGENRIEHTAHAVMEG